MLRNGLIFAVVFAATSIAATVLVVNRPKPSTPPEDSKAASPALIGDEPMPPTAPAPSADSQATAPTGIENNDFEGKFVWVVEDRDRSNSSTLLENVHIKQIAGRAFLVGTFVYNRGSESPPQPLVYIAVDRAKGFSIFSKDDVAKLRALYEAKKTAARVDDTSSSTLGGSSAGSSSLPPLPGFSTPRFPGESNE